MRMNPKLLTRIPFMGIIDEQRGNMQYNTKKKKAILHFFTVYPDTWFTAEQVAVALDDIGRSTVYRVIGELCDGGMLVKDYSDKAGCAVYRADKEACHEHFHLKCVKCGKYIHVEDKRTEELLASLAKDNAFSLDVGKTVLYGTCEECKGGESK